MTSDTCFKQCFGFCFLLEPGGIIPLSLLLYLEEEGQSKGEEQHPYRELDITITVRPLSLTFHPPQILLPPVPLQSSTTATLTLLAVGYPMFVFTHTLTHTHTNILYVLLAFSYTFCFCGDLTNNYSLIQ